MVRFIKKSYELVKMRKIILVFALLSTFTILMSTASATPNMNDHDLIVVRGDQIIDYTVVSSYSSTYSVPIVSVSPDNISREMRQSLINYEKDGHNNAILIGGTAAISSDIEQELVDMGFNTERLWDWDRYGTSARVAIDLWQSSDAAVMVDAAQADNLITAQRYGLELGLPILFADSDRIPDSVITAIEELAVEKIYVIGDLDTGTLQDLGLSVESIETEKIDFPEPEDTGVENVHFYLFFLLILALLAFFLVYYYQSHSKVPYAVFTDDEKKIIDTILENDSLEQQALPEMTGFSRPKVSRLIKDLRARDIVSREKKKKTYVLNLKRRIEF